MISGLKERFAIIRAESCLNVKDFAASLGMEPTTVSSIESGKREPSKEVLYNLAVKHEVSLNWIFTGEGKMFTSSQPHEAASDNKKPIPIFSASNLPEKVFLVPLLEQKLSAGPGADLPEDNVEKGLIPVPSYLSKYGKNIKALTVEGDSMYPTLHRGDMVVCDSCGWSGEGVYAVRMNGKGFVKRVTQRPGKVVLLSDNPKYPPLEEPEESQDIRPLAKLNVRNYKFRR
ncbi:MAG: XRE family transcriptional regulator [Treponema sp.]|jgi:phage repressor protein C with HTH and peptisase S24 domain|nr:XRE family transcriptional regulator [Treponema sp.]